MITIFTPTYNRADQLCRLYQSLIRQDNHDFEWLVIDDGSTDNTKLFIEKFRESAAFSIRYEYQQNGGKHRAYNLALELAHGNWLFCVDSDDWLADGALTLLEERLKNESAQILVAYKSDEHGKLLSDPLPQENGLSSLYRLQFEQNCHGEFTLIFKTAYARKFPFPTFQNEKFLTESVIYDRMARDSLASFFPERVTICEYQPGGLSDSVNRMMRENPAGFCLYYMQRIDLQPSLLKRIMTAGKYHAFCLFAGVKQTPYQGAYPALVKLTMPIGWACWLYYKLFRGF